MKPLLLILAVLPLVARAEEGDPPPANWDEYQAVNEVSCVGPIDGKQAAETTWEVGAFRYTVNGARGRIVRTTPRQNPAQVRLGIVSTIKDDAEETQANLTDDLAKFKAADVDGIVIGGDTAFEEMEMESIIGRLAVLKVPVYAVIGNTESRGGWNRAAHGAAKTNPNVLNMDLLRRVDADGWDLVSLPGYYDKRYTHQGGSCTYSPDDARDVGTLVEGLEGPVVFLTHGPPKMAGKGALDFVPEAGNVGDPNLTDMITKAKIPFGIFGHILEAGGRGTDLSGKKEVKPLAFAEQLFVNPGSANSLPWRMNSGPTSYGMAMILTIEGKKAKYEVIRNPRRIAVE